MSIIFIIGIQWVTNTNKLRESGLRGLHQEGNLVQNLPKTQHANHQFESHTEKLTMTATDDVSLQGVGGN